MRLLQLLCLALVVTFIYAGVTGVSTGVAKATSKIETHNSALSDSVK